MALEVWRRQERRNAPAEMEMEASVLEGRVCPDLRKESPDPGPQGHPTHGLQQGLIGKPVSQPEEGDLLPLTPIESGSDQLWGHRLYKVTCSIRI